VLTSFPLRTLRDRLAAISIILKLRFFPLCLSFPSPPPPPPHQRQDSHTVSSKLLLNSGVAGLNSNGFTTFPFPAISFWLAGSAWPEKLAFLCAATISSPPLWLYSLLRKLIFVGSCSFSPVLVKRSGGALPAVGEPDEWRIWGSTRVEVVRVVVARRAWKWRMRGRCIVRCS
jgi:hypothetical protein